MSDKNNLFLNHILDSCAHIIEFTKNVDFEIFKKTRLIQSAVIRELEIIGEATKNLTDDLKKTFKSIPWLKIAGMRDKLIHGYFMVDLKEIWNTAKKDISTLKNSIEIIIRKKDKDKNND
ncbi:hypothetical protein ES705_50572 [subsurface metagenome]